MQGNINNTYLLHMQGGIRKVYLGRARASVNQLAAPTSIYFRSL